MSKNNKKFIYSINYILESTNGLQYGEYKEFDKLFELNSFVEKMLNSGSTDIILHMYFNVFYENVRKE